MQALDVWQTPFLYIELLSVHLIAVHDVQYFVQLVLLVLKGVENIVCGFACGFLGQIPHCQLAPMARAKLGHEVPFKDLLAHIL